MNRLLLSYPPSTNRYWRNMRGRMVKSSEATAFIKIAQQLAMIARYKPLQGNVSVSIYLHPKTKKDGTASDIRLDLDNCLKVAIDSMNGIAYNDDKQIIRLFAEIGQPMPNGGLTVIWEDA